MTSDCSRHSGGGKEKCFSPLKPSEFEMSTRLSFGLKIPGYHPIPLSNSIRNRDIKNTLHPPPSATIKDGK